jgi:hypothetical protein
MRIQRKDRPWSKDSRHINPPLKVRPDYANAGTNWGGGGVSRVPRTSQALRHAGEPWMMWRFSPSPWAYL